MSHLVPNFNCLSATACFVQGEPAASGILEFRCIWENWIHPQQLEILMQYPNSCELEFI